MSISTCHQIPTGYLFTGNYSRGALETLSIGDYGKPFNVKADFLGYTKEIHGVPNTHCMPLSEKWVITVSTQYGCPMACTFCDVPKLGFHGNASFDDLKAQLYNAIGLFPDVKYTERLNLHFARMGDPSFNEDVLKFAEWLYFNKKQIADDTGLRIEVIHPVFTTCCPRTISRLGDRLREWCRIKNEVYNGQAGLQLSINTTSDETRDATYLGKQMKLEDIARMAETFPDPISRKYCLNFAYATGNEVDGEKLRQWFPPERFMCKITPIHNNNASREHGIETVGGYESYAPYAVPEEELKAVGYDVLVFVPSQDEEHGLVTCGNLILGGSQFRQFEDGLKIIGQPTMNTGGVE